MKIFINQYDKEAMARLHSNGRYVLVPIKWRAVKRELEARPFSAKSVFSAIRRIAPLADNEPSDLDVLLPGRPLRWSLAIWQVEIVSKLANMDSIYGKIIQYFRQSSLRLDYQLNLIKVCCFIAGNLNYRHWCTFYSAKEITAATKVSQESVSHCLSHLRELGLLDVVVCRSQYRNRVIGSYVRVSEEFKEQFLVDIAWPEDATLTHYTELDYLNHLNEIERVGRELQSLIQGQNYPEPIINQAYFLLIG